MMRQSTSSNVSRSGRKGLSILAAATAVMVASSSSANALSPCDGGLVRNFAGVCVKSTLDAVKSKTGLLLKTGSGPLKCLEGQQWDPKSGLCVNLNLRLGDCDNSTSSSNTPSRTPNQKNVKAPSRPSGSDIESTSPLDRHPSTSSSDPESDSDDEGDSSTDDDRVVHRRPNQHHTQPPFRGNKDAKDTKSKSPVRRPNMGSVRPPSSHKEAKDTAVTPARRPNRNDAQRPVEQGPTPSGKDGKTCPESWKFDELLKICVKAKIDATKLVSADCGKGWKFDLVLGICVAVRLENVKIDATALVGNGKMIKQRRCPSGLKWDAVLHVCAQIDPLDTAVDLLVLPSNQPTSSDSDKGNKAVAVVPTRNHRSCPNGQRFDAKSGACKSTDGSDEDWTPTRRPNQHNVNAPSTGSSCSDDSCPWSSSSSPAPAPASGSDPLVLPIRPNRNDVKTPVTGSSCPKADGSCFLPTTKECQDGWKYDDLLDICAEVKLDKEGLKVKADAQALAQKIKANVDKTVHL